MFHPAVSFMVFGVVIILVLVLGALCECGFFTAFLGAFWGVLAVFPEIVLVVLTFYLVVVLVDFVALGDARRASDLMGEGVDPGAAIWCRGVQVGFAR